MAPRDIFIGVVVVSILNGLFSPAVGTVFAFAPVWYPAFMPANPAIIFYVASLFVSTATLVLSGVPAALYERLGAAGRGTVGSMAVWLGGAVTLSLPALGRFTV